MTLPAGITTCTVTIGKALGSLGEDASLSGTLTLDRRLVWSATGDTLYGVPSTVTPSQSGGWLSFIVAHVDQAGFVDQSGNSITGFSYTFSGRATFADGSVEPIVKHFQVFVGQSTLDLDLLPDGPATLPVVTPTPPVDNAAVAGFISNAGATKDALSVAIAAALADFDPGTTLVEDPSGSGLFVVNTGGSSGGTTVLDQFHGVPYTAYGHSFGQIQGTANAWSASVYPVRLRDDLRTDPTMYTNRTSNGLTMDQIAAAAATTWSDGRGGLVTLMGNQNSVGAQHASGTAETDFKTGLRAFLNTMRGNTGYPPTVLVIKDVTCTSVGYARYNPPPTDADVTRYNGWINDVVGESTFTGGWVVVANPMGEGWNPVTMTCADGQHPNDRGMACISRAAMKALTAAGYRKGLNVGITDTTAVPGTGGGSGGGGGTTPGAFLPGATIADNFDRADSASTLGSTSTGSVAWSPLVGTWGIDAGRAYAVVGGEVTVVLNTPSSDGTVQVTLAAGTENPGESCIAFRFSDVDNGWIIYGGGATGSKWTLTKKVAGSYEFKTRSADVIATAGDVCTVVMAGSTITAKVNGTTIGTVTDSHNATVTKHGMRANTNSGPGGRFDGWSYAPAA